MIVIIGAGLVGAVLAMHLAQAGFEVKLYEQRGDPREIEPQLDRSINITLCERGFRSLDLIGVGDLIRKLCIPIYGRVIHTVEGEAYQPYGNRNEAIYSIGRYDLNCILLDCAARHEKIDLCFNHKCLDIDMHTATLKIQNEITGQIQDIQASQIFGADGAYSTVRQKMQRLKRFNYSQTYLNGGYKELILPATEWGDWPLQNNAIHMWPQDNFMLLAFPNLDGTFTCTLHLPFEGQISHASITTYEDYYYLFANYFPDILSMIAPHLTRYVENPIETLITIKCFPWTFKDKIALIGDACHAIYPFYGQGSNAGFEDCQILLECLKADHGDWGAALPKYETRCKVNMDIIADLSAEHFEVLQKSIGDPTFRLRKKLERKLQLLHPDYASLYHNVSFTCMPYTEALRLEQKNSVLIEQLLAVEGIEDKLDSPEMDSYILSLLFDCVAERKPF
ncbi:MAG: FAD-dependent monooxygenase [Caldilineaceae bacterium]|nr:FAD-dependent monooxygenase [Caldilineaceae bacterium]MCB0140351.1 FAD-dependent monooxygenase [Caldilineaceae bacterium]